MSDSFNFSVRDDDKGILYTPWTDGHAVGFRVTFPTGEDRYIYLNPSGDSDGGTPDVFLYMGHDGVSDKAVHYYDTSLEAFDE